MALQLFDGFMCCCIFVVAVLQYHGKLKDCSFLYYVRAMDRCSYIRAFFGKELLGASKGYSFILWRGDSNFVLPGLCRDDIWIGYGAVVDKYFQHRSVFTSLSCYDDWKRRFFLLDKEKLDKEMLQAATIDELTNILNRRTFILRSKEIISMFERRMEPVSFLLLDIDVLKKINDEYGHSVGDIILRCFADTIRKLLRNYDLFGRYGGEEFSVLLPGTNESESAEIAERLRNAVEDSCLIDYPEIKYTVSIGAATVTPDNETTVDMLFKLSDNALYLAKLQGKNRVVWLQK